MCTCTRVCSHHSDRARRRSPVPAGPLPPRAGTVATEVAATCLCHPYPSLVPQLKQRFTFPSQNRHHLALHLTARRSTGGHHRATKTRVAAFVRTRLPPSGAPPRAARATTRGLGNAVHRAIPSSVSTSVRAATYGHRLPPGSPP
jgi:hypothetical protein